MKMLFEFTFDRAGQGLFYHGIIGCDEEAHSQCSIVSDCGTIGNEHQLSKRIDDFADRIGNEGIGLLAISYFHRDHVSHIPELLRRVKANTVMLPHVAKELRLVFWAKSLSENGYDKDSFNNSEKSINSLEFCFVIQLVFSANLSQNKL